MLFLTHLARAVNSKGRWSCAEAMRRAIAPSPHGRGRGVRGPAGCGTKPLTLTLSQRERGHPALCIPPFAYRFKHELLGVLDEGSPQVSRRLEPVDGARQDHTAGALPIELRLVHARRDFALVPQRLGCPDQTQAGAGGHDITPAQGPPRARL